MKTTIGSGGQKTLRSIQVCYDIDGENPAREVNGLLAAMKQFDLEEGLLLTNSQEDEVRVDGRKMTGMPYGSGSWKTKNTQLKLPD